MATIAVSGAAGFIGGWVVDNLLSNGHHVIAVDHANRGNYPDDVEVMLADVRDRTAITEVAAHADGIIHLAAVLGTQETIKNPHPAAETNILGGLNVLTACEQYNIPLVNIAVGNHWMLNTYSTTKNAFERLARMYQIEHGLRFANVRCVNAYGPRQRAAEPFASGKVRKIAPAFICRALSNMPIEVYGDGEQISDMVYVGDVANVLVLAMEHLLNGGNLEETLEVGPVESSTVNEVARFVRDISYDYTESFVGIEHLPMRPGEIAGDSVTANPETLQVLGIHPRTLMTLVEGLYTTIPWYYDNRGVTWEIPYETR